jgi:hypothetical protein
MRDMTLVTNDHQVNGVSSIPLIPLTPEQELHTRLRLSQALQMTLDIEEILNLFYKLIQPLVNACIPATTV